MIIMKIGFLGKQMSIQEHSELKRIRRKAKRFTTRNKFPPAQFKIDRGNHPGICL